MKSCLICKKKSPEDNVFCNNCGMSFKKIGEYKDLIGMTVERTLDLLREMNMLKSWNQEDTYSRTILGILKHSKISLSIETIHVLTGISKVRIAKKLKKLEGRGLIKRTTKSKVSFWTYS